MQSREDQFSGGISSGDCKSAYCPAFLAAWRQRNRTKIRKGLFSSYTWLIIANNIFLLKESGVSLSPEDIQPFEELVQCTEALNARDYSLSIE